MQSWKLQLLSLLGGGWQFRWYGLAAAWIVCLAGWAVVALVPNVYQSSAKVYIDTDTLMRPLLKGIVVSTNTQQEINVMLKTLLTAPNIERVVRVTNPKAASMTTEQMQDAVAKLTKNVTLKGAGTRNLYTIGFEDSNPVYAQSVAQTLLSVMVDSNIGDQRRQSDDARSFLDAQIASYQQKLQAADRRKAEFKAAHLDVFLDGDGIDAAKTAVANATSRIAEIGARVSSLRRQISQTPATIDVNAPAPISLGGAGTVANKRQQLGMARAKLDELRAHYTDDYPDVIAQKQLIAHLKADLDRKRPASEDPNLQGISNPAYVMLRTKLADEEVNMAVAQERLSSARKRLTAAGSNAAQAIMLKRKYESMDRDYQVLKKNYEELVSRREAANISQAAGDTQSSLVFRVVDPPTTPSRPVAPNRILFNLMVLLAGLGTGVAAAVGLGQVSGRFLTMEQLGDAFALPVLGAVTIARTAADTARLWRATSLFVAGTGLLMASYVVVLFFFHTYVQSAVGGII